MSTSPEAWLETGFELVWPDGIPRKDYGRAVDMVMRMGGTLAELIGRRARRAADGEAVPVLSSKPPRKHVRSPEGTLNDRIMQLLETGELTIREIAERLEANPNSVSTQIYRLPRKPRKAGKTITGQIKWTLANTTRAKPRAPKTGTSSTHPNGSPKLERAISVVKEKGPLTVTQWKEAADVSDTYLSRLLQEKKLPVVEDGVGPHGATLWRYKNGAPAQG